MRHFHYAALAVVTVFGFASVASAADMPVKAPVYKPQPRTFSWTGLYVGASGGCGWAKQEIKSFTPSDVDDVFFGDFTSTGNGGCFGGGQIGYNYQFSERWVVGIEADAMWSSLKTSGTLFEDDGAESTNYNGKLTSFGTVRARLGMATQWGAVPILPYITGGWAWGRNSVSATSDIGDTPTFPSSDKQTHSGWTIGAGLEAAVYQNWSVKVEYLYLDLGSKNYPNVAIEAPTDTGVFVPGANINLKVQTIKLGLNYRFL